MITMLYGKPTSIMAEWIKECYGTDNLQLCFKCLKDGSTISLNNVNGTYSISYDNETWIDYTLGTILTLKLNQKVYFSARTVNETCYKESSSSYPYPEEDYKFVITGRFSALGTVQSLLKRDCSVLSAPYRCFYKLFYCCSGLVKAPNMTASSLSEKCYESMFTNATNITSVNMPNITSEQYDDDTNGPLASDHDIEINFK